MELQHRFSGFFEYVHDANAKSVRLPEIRADTATVSLRFPATTLVLDDEIVRVAEEHLSFLRSGA